MPKSRVTLYLLFARFKATLYMIQAKGYVYLNEAAMNNNNFVKIIAYAFVSKAAINGGNFEMTMHMPNLLSKAAINGSDFEKILHIPNLVSKAAINGGDFEKTLHVPCHLQQLR